MKSFKAFSTLRIAQNDARIVGIRLKKSKGGAKDDAPAAPKGGEDD